MEMKSTTALAKERPLLQHIEPRLQGATKNLFLIQVRNGLTKPSSIVHAIIGGLHKTIADKKSPERAGNAQAMLDAIQAYPAEALILAYDCVSSEPQPAPKVTPTPRKRDKATPAQV